MCTRLACGDVVMYVNHDSSFHRPNTNSPHSETLSILSPSMNFDGSIILFASVAVACDAFVPASPNTPFRAKTTCVYNIFDDLKLIFSEEGKENRAAYDAREKEEMMSAQQEIMQRRRNPEKMEQYNAEIEARRSKLKEEKDVWKFQQKTDGDPLQDWTRLRAEGKIKAGSDLERDESTRRFGSEGLNEIRTDELLPYIDQGYVDDDADFMGNLMGMFGGSKKKD